MKRGPAASTAPVAFITGASSGLGAHFATLLARRGMRLLLAARRTDRLAVNRKQCLTLGAPAVAVVTMDVSDAASVEAAIAETISQFGRIDTVVNNAGIVSTAPALKTPVEAFETTMATNLRGYWLVATAAARTMKDTGGGDIVNIASIVGLRVAAGVAPYAISKAGVIQMTRSLAIVWAQYGIRVNALAPGYIETDLNTKFFATEAGQALIKRIPQQRLGTLADLDAPFLLFATGASPYLTGAVLTVDGGHHINSL